MKICKIPADDDVVDPLTKALVQAKHDRHVRSLRLRVMPSYALGSNNIVINLLNKMRCDFI